MGLEDTWRDLLWHAQRERARRTDDIFVELEAHGLSMDIGLIQASEGL